MEESSPPSNRPIAIPKWVFKVVVLDGKGNVISNFTLGKSIWYNEIEFGEDLTNSDVDSPIGEVVKLLDSTSKLESICTAGIDTCGQKVLDGEWFVVVIWPLIEILSTFP